jgi:G3E family GTPase
LKSLHKIPVLIVTGFLGAGKTTFINHLVSRHRHLKLALIENEFGEVSVDSQLVTGINGNQIFELSNGCICCTITNEFSLALTNLAEQLPNIGFLLIETTGVADLSQVIRPFYADASLKKQFLLTGTVCMVDAINFEQMVNYPVQQMQLIHSDYILINKAENVSPGKITEITKIIGAYNSSAKIEITSFARTEDFSLETLASDIQEKTEKKLSAPVLFRVIESPRFTTFTHRFSGYVNLHRFRYWFDYFAAINQTDIFRVKGILYPKGEAVKTIVQSVGGATSYTEGSFILPSDEIINTLIFIGKSVDFERIVHELERYLSEDENP